jgi:hypothetical protein
VLVTDTKCGDPTDALTPVLFLVGGSHTIDIHGVAGPALLSKWEKLGQTIYDHLR